MFYAFVCLTCPVVFKCLGGFDVYGRENVPKKGGFIAAANHVSYLDPLAIGISCPRRMSYMARHDLFSNPIFNGIIRNLGAFPVKRKTADLSAIKEAIKRLKEGKGLLIFPEGTRQTGGSMAEQAQPGIGFLAAKAQVPVIPVFVKGTEKALPKNARCIHRARISVYYGKQISFERRLPYQEIAQIILEGIRETSCSSGN
jgi:1-acyl-sn-glycerol-3-phosphate acyltransferase